jgi:hypothetical protein
MTVYNCFSIPVFGVLLVSFSFGQSTIDLCGTVTNAAGSPVEGVSVKLQIRNLTALTQADGSYCIHWAAGVSNTAGRVVERRDCDVFGKKLIVSLVNGDRFGAGLFDIRGRTLWERTEASWGGGTHECALPMDRISPQAGMLQVNLGAVRYVYRFALCGHGSYLYSRVKTKRAGPDQAATSAAGGALSKSAALPILDTLVATGQGYAMNNKIRCYVYTFTDTIDFALGEIDSFSEARQQIVHRVNDYRATLGMKRLIRNKAREACVDTQVQLDFASNTAHGAFGNCTESAQNECPGWGGSNMLSVANNIVISCMQSMWDEGPGTPYSAHGHYINMTNTAYSKIACGFYYNVAGKTMWAAQDFFR